MNMIVADAGPLIGLSKTKRLDLLTGLFHDVVIPDKVVAELRLEEPRPGVLQLGAILNENRGLRTSTPKREGTIAGLDVGESAAIFLAEEFRCLLLIDERHGRATAMRRGITVVGTGRVLIAANEHGLIASVRSELDALWENGYRLSVSLYNHLLELAGEQGDS